MFTTKFNGTDVNFQEMTSIWIVMGLDQLIWLPLQSIRFSTVENLEGWGGIFWDMVPGPPLSILIPPPQFNLREVRKYIFSFIHFPLKIMCFFPVIFTTYL